ncbi:MAG: relaxase/mobilization nuclease domain-containing protein [Alphaproteobacteria bacterium]|nr:relaxase/mobilization nuclease domain-containing protein [Alphaproteobacteria bacterium]
MANKRNWLDEHIRGIYVKHQRFPIDYPPPAKQKATLSFKVPIPESMVKVAFYIKSVQGVKNTLQYIAHGSEGMEKDARVYDDERRLIQTEKLNETIDAYQMKQRRKNGNLMVHLIVSFPKRMKVGEEEGYRFVERYMEPFAKKGYRYLYAVHTHQSATHGHILLQMSNGRERLKFKKPQLQMLRQHQVEVAKEFGWEMQATRFQDRDFSLTQMIVPRKRKTIRYKQRRKLEEIAQKNGISLQRSF